MSFTIIILIVMPLLFIVLFLYLKWYIKTRTSASGVLKETRIEVKKWISEAELCIAEINSVTDRNLQLIEDRINKLNELLKDTDKRIALYIKEVEKSKKSEALYTQLGRGVRAAVMSEAGNSSDLQLSNIRPNPDINSSVHSAPKTVAQHSANVSELSAGPAGEVTVQSRTNKKNTQASSVQQKSKKQIREEIGKCAQDGLSNQEIAARLGISIAEVDIALQLIRK